MRAANPLRGEGSIVLEGKSFPLRYSWTALAELHAKFPNGFALNNPAVLAEVLALGLRHADPDMTPEKLMEMSPPLIDAIDAANRAIAAAYYGDKEPPENPENPPLAPSSTGSESPGTPPSGSA